MEENKLNVLHKIISHLDTIEKIDKRTNRAFDYIGSHVSLHLNAWEQLFDDTEDKVINGMRVICFQEGANIKREINFSELERVIDAQSNINELTSNNDWIGFAYSIYILLEADTFKKLFEFYNTEEFDNHTRLSTHLRGHRIEATILKGEQ